VLPIALDAVGGDHAPHEVLAGARVAVEELGIPVVLVGPEAVVAESGFPHIVATEIIGMGDDGAQGVRRKKDSSLVRAAEAVRDGKASAMVSAGNTGATMAAALLRMGRIKGVSRPAIATMIPVPGGWMLSPASRQSAGARAARAVLADGTICASGSASPSRASACFRSARRRRRGQLREGGASAAQAAAAEFHRQRGRTRHL
jgi:hypothetical protein